jgi:phosphoserine aminotransferase
VQLKNYFFEMSTKIKFNFSAGPSTLPRAVLETVHNQWFDYKGTGCSIVELSHRSKEVSSMMSDARQSLARALGVPDSHSVLFLQGGATTQFSAVPLNLNVAAADYIVTGGWSKKALAEASRYIDAKQCTIAQENEQIGQVEKVGQVASSSGCCARAKALTQATYLVRRNARYAFYCANETVHGVEFDRVPRLCYADNGEEVAADDGVILVADASSNLLSRRVDFARHDVVVAGAQKNCGIAGVVLAIVRNSLIDDDSLRSPTMPTMLSWRVARDAQSAFNTPPVFAIYVTGLVLDWLAEQGGVDAIAKRNEARANALYAVLGEAAHFRCLVEAHADRSRMNVVFRLDDAALEDRFIDEARARGLSNLRGHRSLGGCRASIYNAMTQQGVDALCNFIREFDAQVGQQQE